MCLNKSPDDAVLTDLLIKYICKLKDETLADRRKQTLRPQNKTVFRARHFHMEDLQRLDQAFRSEW